MFISNEPKNKFLSMSKVILFAYVTIFSSILWANCDLVSAQTTTVNQINQENIKLSKSVWVTEIEGKLDERIHPYNYIQQQREILYKINKHGAVQLTVDILKLHEGFRSKPYRCTSGQLTYGYGTTTKNPKQCITPERAEELLFDAIEADAKKLDKLIPWWRSMSMERQVALLNLTYNMGVDNLMKFKRMLSAMEQGDYELASKQLLLNASGGKSRYYKQVGTRAVHVSNAIKTGVWNVAELKSFYS